jgi:hypothetical protein
MMTSYSMSTAKTNLFIIFASTMSTLFALLLVDFIFGRQLLRNIQTYIITNVTTDIEIQFDAGWYELKPNLASWAYWGVNKYIVYTDNNGFRRKSTYTEYKKGDVIFLGDSFTYGINGQWSDTFVGMYQNMTGRVTINAGVSSYSPTAYIYNYNKALSSKLLKPNHIVVVGLDISDVQDEAGVWIDGADHPRKRYKVEVAPNTEAVQANTGKYQITSHLPMTATIYRFVRSFFVRPIVENNSSPNVKVFDQPRSAFTWEDWDKLNQFPAYPDGAERGYAPLGVRGGLDKIETKLKELIALVLKEQSRVYVLIYPWPAQLYHKDKFDWSLYVRDMCRRIGCGGVIDVIPQFRTKVLVDKEWYRDYFIFGDVHFNKAGNKIVADELVKYFTKQ